MLIKRPPKDLFTRFPKRAICSLCLCFIIIHSQASSTEHGKLCRSVVSTHSSKHVNMCGNSAGGSKELLVNPQIYKKNIWISDNLNSNNELELISWCASVSEGVELNVLCCVNTSNSFASDESEMWFGHNIWKAKSSSWIWMIDIWFWRKNGDFNWDRMKENFSLSTYPACRML